MVYKIHNFLSEYSFRVRKLEITYRKSSGDEPDELHSAFVIESAERAAARLGMKTIKVDSVKVSQLDAHQLSIYALFQFMIGNTDWSVRKGPATEDCCHNGKVVAPPDSRDGWVVLPYDFDQSGIINTRYAAPDDNRGAGTFFRNGGRFFFRFFRLAALAAALYAAIYVVQQHWAEQLLEKTRDVTSELGVLGRYLTVWVPVALLLVLVRVIFDYAKIATVVDDRRSMLFAALRGAGFVVLYPLKTLGLCFAWLVVGTFALAVYIFLAPGAGVSTPATVAIAFAIGQAFLMSRLLMRLSLLAGQTELYKVHSTPTETPASLQST